MTRLRLAGCDHRLVCQFIQIIYGSCSFIIPVHLFRVCTYDQKAILSVFTAIRQTFMAHKPVFAGCVRNGQAVYAIKMGFREEWRPGWRLCGKMNRFSVISNRPRRARQKQRCLRPQKGPKGVIYLPLGTHLSFHFLGGLRKSVISIHPATVVVKKMSGHWHTHTHMQNIFRASRCTNIWKTFDKTS